MKGFTAGTQRADKPVAILRANLERTFTRWDVQLLDEAGAVEAVVKEPAWCPIPWKVPEGPLAASDPLVTQLFLTKVRLLADAVYGLTARDENPSVAETELSHLGLALRDRVSEDIALSPIKIEATLWPDGEANVQLSFDRKSSVVETGDSEAIEAYARNSLRRELRQQIARLREQTVA